MYDDYFPGTRHLLHRHPVMVSPLLDKLQPLDDLHPQRDQATPQAMVELMPRDMPLLVMPLVDMPLLLILVNLVPRHRTQAKPPTLGNPGKLHIPGNPDKHPIRGNLGKPRIQARPLTLDSKPIPKQDKPPTPVSQAMGNPVPQPLSGDLC